MKFWTIAVIALSLFIVSCGRKSVPTTSVPNKKPTPTHTTNPPKSDATTSVPKKDSIVVNEPLVDTVPPAMVYAKVFTVVDSHGRLLLSQEKKPANVNPDWNALTNLRAFTPNQAQTLASRYSSVPPKVIYVPDNLSKKGRKGKYYIYNKKFWFWQKSDGLFYLDTNYYQ